ncbi:MAG: DNA-binding domain-containing protein [Sphingomicrobium sp.]
MTLALIQRRFLGAVTAVDETGIADWPTDMWDGLVVYRTAYRSRLLDCLRGAFDKCRRWIGDESFDAAAAHHLILHPPSSWTLDDLGRGFSETLGMLFPDDPEVEELAWLEWEMQQIFTSRDVATLDAADFAERASSFTEEDWLNLRLAFVPTLSMRIVATDCAALWTAIDDGQEMPALQPPADTSTLLIWRHVLKSRFRMLGASEASSLALMRSGGTFEQLCAALVLAHGDAAGVEAAGTMLGRWITDGLVANEPLMFADQPINGPTSPLDD